MQILRHNDRTSWRYEDRRDADAKKRRTGRGNTRKKSRKIRARLHICKKSCTFGLRLLRIPPKLHSHCCANHNLFSIKLRLCKHRRQFFAKNLANLKNL